MIGEGLARRWRTMAQNGTLNAKQTAAIVALLDPANGSTVAAAKAAGVPLRTMNRWLQEDSAFVAQLRQAEGAAIDQSVRRLISVSAAADSTIVSIMSNRDNPPGVRLRAAALVKESLVRLRELRNIESRLAALEAHDTSDD